MEADLQAQSDYPSTFATWLFSSVGPICSILLFTFVPLLLSVSSLHVARSSSCLQSKFAAVFDLLYGGGDVLQHIDLGVGQIILAPGVNMEGITK